MRSERSLANSRAICRNMVDVTECLIEQCRDVGIEESVDHVAPASVTDHETEVSQDPQLVGDGRLLHLHRCAEITYRARTGT
jgi:hypothetical protein